MDDVEYEDYNVERYVDKSKWPDGPWKDEADRVSWTSSTTGYRCVVRRGPLGALNGYVGVPLAHPYAYKGYDEIDISVHGGLTFAEAQNGVPEENAGFYYFGFDCAHAYDVVPTMGGAFIENQVYRTLAYVLDEVISLAAQLKEAESHGSPQEEWAY